MSKNLRTIVTPAVTTNLSVATDEPLTYWKQLLPVDTIKYKGRPINFDDEYHKACVDSFKTNKVQQIAFQLADPLNGHGRDMDPERQRGVLTDMATFNDLPDEVKADVKEPGLYGKVQFFNKKAAKAVRMNPGLGVSARIRENTVDKYGNKVRAAVVHVLGTLDPVATGMSPWRAVDLSSEITGEMLDLSNSEYEGVSMAKGKGGTAVLDDVEPLSADEFNSLLARLTDEQVQTLVDALPADEDPDDDDEDDDGDDSDDEPDGDLQEANLSNADRRAIDLSNAATRAADRKASDALRRLAAAEWREQRTQYEIAGVPPAVLDLAAPILSRPEEFVVDLSNEDGPGAELNVAEIIRAMLESQEGTIDMSREMGHGGSGDDDDEDEAILAKWDSESPFTR